MSGYRDDIFHGLQDDIVDYMQGTCMLPMYAVSHFDLECDDEDVDDLMLEYNYEMCPCCGWWC